MNESVRLSAGAGIGVVPAGDISVVIPTCDRPDLLREAIASVLAQTLPPREILVIDNGMVAVDRAEWWERVRLYRIAPRVGVSRARNVGAAIATGDYVAFLDDDDWWEPDFLLAARTAMVSEAVRCVYGRKVVSKQGSLAPYRLALPGELSVPTLLRRNPGTGGMNLLIERRLYLEVGGFDDRLHLSEDRALALEILLKGERIAVAPDAVAVVRHHGADRLRQRHMRKLPFIWKYRRLYSPPGFALAIGRVVARTLYALTGSAVSSRQMPGLPKR